MERTILRLPMLSMEDRLTLYLWNRKCTRPHTAVKQKILKMLEIRKSMIYNLQWKVNGLRTFPFTASNDRIIARQSWIRNSLSEKLGFWIPIFSGIQVSLSWIPDSKAQDFGFRKQIFQDSGFHKQKFPFLDWFCFQLLQSGGQSLRQNF